MIQTFPDTKPLFNKVVDKVQLWNYEDPVVEFCSTSYWHAFEFIDGTPVRIIWEKNWSNQLQDRIFEVAIKGNNWHSYTEDQKGVSMLKYLFHEGVMKRLFGETEVALYGYIFGEGIGQTDVYIKDGVTFALLHVNIDGNWASIADIRAVAKSLKIDTLPYLGGGSIYSGVRNLREPIASYYGDFPLEGILLVPDVVFKDSHSDYAVRKLLTSDVQCHIDSEIANAEPD